jgi:hypothetical protein
LNSGPNQVDAQSTCQRRFLRTVLSSPAADIILQLSADYLGAFEKLIAAYGRIAENLPRFDRLSNAFKDSSDFQQVLAVVYSDILDFHRKAYKFFKKNGDPICTPKREYS